MTAVRNMLSGLAALSLAATVGLAATDRSQRPAKRDVFRLALGIGRPDSVPAAASPRLLPAAEPDDRVERTGS
jgi:hypothetical protein